MFGGNSTREEVANSSLNYIIGGGHGCRERAERITVVIEIRRQRYTILFQHRIGGFGILEMIYKHHFELGVPFYECLNIFEPLFTLRTFAAPERDKDRATQFIQPSFLACRVSNLNVGNRNIRRIRRDGFGGS